MPVTDKTRYIFTNAANLKHFIMSIVWNVQALKLFVRGSRRWKSELATPNAALHAIHLINYFLPNSAERYYWSNIASVGTETHYGFRTSCKQMQIDLACKHKLFCGSITRPFRWLAWIFHLKILIRLHWRKRDFIDYKTCDLFQTWCIHAYVPTATRNNYCARKIEIERSMTVDFNLHLKIQKTHY